MKKILLSTLIVLGIVGATIGATRAIFTSTENIDSNTFSTGTIIIEGQGDTLVPMSFTNLKPGDWNRKWLTFRNVGSLAIDYLSVNKINVSDPKGLLTQVEVSLQCALASTPSNMAFFTDSWGTLGPVPTVDTWFTNSDMLDGPAFYRTAAGLIGAGEDYTCAMDFTLPVTVGNAYQDATATFDLVFTAEQTHP